MLSILERAAMNFIPLLESGLQKNITTRLCESQQKGRSTSEKGLGRNASRSEYSMTRLLDIYEVDEDAMLRTGMRG